MFSKDWCDENIQRVNVGREIVSMVTSASGSPHIDESESADPPPTQGHPVAVNWPSTCTSSAGGSNPDLIQSWKLLLWLKRACKSKLGQWKWCSRQGMDSAAESQGCTLTYLCNGFYLYEPDPSEDRCPGYILSVFPTTLQWQKGHSTPVGQKNNFQIIEQALDHVLSDRNMDTSHVLCDPSPTP